MKLMITGHIIIKSILLQLVRKRKGILKIEQSIKFRDIGLVWELNAPTHWLKLIFSVILSPFQGFSWCGLFITQYVSLVLCLCITSFLSNFVSLQLYQPLCFSPTSFLSNFIYQPLCFSPTSVLSHFVSHPLPFSRTLFLSPTSFLLHFLSLPLLFSPTSFLSHFVSLPLRCSPTSFLSKVNSRATSFFLTSGRVCAERRMSLCTRLANVQHNGSFTFTGDSHFNRLFQHVSLARTEAEDGDL